MSMKEIDNENATKAKAIRDNVYTIDTIEKLTNTYIEHEPSKPTTTNLREKEIDKYANTQTTSDSNGLLEKAKTRTFWLKDVS